jgi:hypothetical protein
MVDAHAETGASPPQGKQSPGTAGQTVRRAFALTFMSMGTTAVAVGGGLLAFLAIAAARLFRDGWAQGWPVVKSSMGGDAGVGIMVAISVWLVIFLVSLGRAIEERRRKGSDLVALGAVDLYPILDAQLRLSNANALHESHFEQLRSEDDAIRADVNQDKAAIQALTKRLTELSKEIAYIIVSDVKTAKGSLGLNSTLRNQVLLLVAELRGIYGRITITGDYPPPPTAPPNLHVSSSMLNKHRREVEDFVGRQTWKQHWDIYHSEFDKRVRETITDLQHANVASEQLIAWPDTVGPDELRHDLPMGMWSRLIPELLSAADALTRSRSS